MENVLDVLRHLVNVSHFRSEEDRDKAHAILNQTEEADNEPTPIYDETVAAQQPEILSPDGSQRWNGSSWEPVPTPETPSQQN